MGRLGLGSLIIVGVVTGFTPSIQAQQVQPYGDRASGKKLWAASVASLLASTAFDAHSSMGRRERNPLLRSSDGSFGWRGVAVKAAIKGGLLAAQWAILRKHPAARRPAAIANFTMTGVFSGIAIRNYRNSRPGPVSLPGVAVSPYLLRESPEKE